MHSTYVYTNKCTYVCMYLCTYVPTDSCSYVRTHAVNGVYSRCALTATDTLCTIKNSGPRIQREYTRTTSFTHRQTDTHIDILDIIRTYVPNTTQGRDQQHCRKSLSLCVYLHTYVRITVCACVQVCFILNEQSVCGLDTRGIPTCRHNNQR